MTSQKKPIYKIDICTDRILDEFDSINEAGRAGFNVSAVSQVANGKRSSHAGFSWQWADRPPQIKHQPTSTKIKFYCDHCGVAVVRDFMDYHCVDRHYCSRSCAGASRRTGW